MPELPEVETIKNQLARVVCGKIIKSVDVRLKKQVKGMSAKAFGRKLAGSRVVRLDRRAKMLIVETRKNDKESRKHEVKYLVFHLKMTGQLIYENNQSSTTKNQKLYGGGHPIKGSLEQLPNQYSHVIFYFNDGSVLYFNDLRQFGWVKLFEQKERLASYLEHLKLGPEPLTQDFKQKEFIRCLTARANSRVYQALMDQKCVVGVGNIYANESLFYARIRPTRRCRNTKIQEYKKLYSGIKKILNQAIKARGTTIGDYLDALGDFGSFSKQLKVYGRAGERCARKDCSGQVTRIKINNRSAFYCPRCQR